MAFPCGPSHAERIAGPPCVLKQPGVDAAGFWGHDRGVAALTFLDDFL